MVANKKVGYFLEASYWREYLKNKRKAKQFYAQINAGHYKKSLFITYEEDLDNYSNNLLNDIIPEHIETNNKAGRTRQGKPLPLQFERNFK